ncbi:LysR family transcriptional regulator [Roseinatronobacter sp. NSM]|uniref:LysR family transcriptional regulator n=1 Tax=Roseinatronobacter sp. NSM TaxID=3457785 RepID=UPI004035E487
MDRLDCDRMFIAVMETGSFTGGAERLGKSSGYASKLVSRLETELGVRLLNRTTRSISATEAGKAYFDQLRPLLDEYDHLDLAVRDASRAPRGRLRLTAPLSFGVIELAPALSDFALRYPEIELDVTFSDRVTNLVDEGFDMAIRIGRPADSSLVARKLCDMRIVVVGAPSLLRADGRAGRARGTCSARLHHRHELPGAGSLAGEVLATPISGRIRYSNAEAGLGLACVPSFVAGASIRAGAGSSHSAGPRDHALRRSRPLSSQPASRRQGPGTRRLPRRSLSRNAPLGTGLGAIPSETDAIIFRLTGLSF